MILTPRIPALFLCVAGLAAWISTARGDDGYRLWLRYDQMAAGPLKTAYAAVLPRIVLATPTGSDSATLAAARDELATGLGGLLGFMPRITIEKRTDIPSAAGEEGYGLKRTEPGTLVISAWQDVGVLHGAFALLRAIQTRQPVEQFDTVSAPKIQRRILDHWDELDGFVERGYAGRSLWEWSVLPDYKNPRYRDYARACASLGLNGAELTNVNAPILVMTPGYLVKVAALADVFRPYGIRVYLTAKFSAPKELGGLPTADPLDPAVIAWWKAKVDEIYRYVPDFGGLLVKASSEGQPGPQDYGRTHADGANVMADALARHGGIVMWRAFVYQPSSTLDRVRQAAAEFKGLDGKFRDNVVVQIKNGPLDFMPREPFHPLFGSMPKTNLAIELQITQEYLGASIELAYLAPLFKEALESDTYRAGPGTTVAHIVDGSVDHHKLTVIAGVANTGTDRDWTGHPLAQSNWYAFGRLAWDHTLTSEQIADEWTKMTYSDEPKVLGTITKMLLASRETVVDYSMPLGLHHIMAEGSHYGPGPWSIVQGPGFRADWSPPYYHQADAAGLGASRSADGSNSIADYAPELAALWGNVDTCPENLLLWFHHVSWDYKMKSGRPMWDELCLRYQQGVDEIRGIQKQWDSLEHDIDPERFAHVQALLRLQVANACNWRDACLLYFQTFSKRPLPAGVEPPAHDLAYYEAVKIRYFPGTPGDPKVTR